MPIRGLLLATALILLPLPLHAHPIFLTGTVGKAPVLAMVTRDGNKLSGWYFYFSEGKLIALGGSDTKGALRLEEKTDTHTTGFFEGKIDQPQWIGTWHDEKNKLSLPFLLRENNDPLANFSGQVRCAIRKVEKNIGPTYHNLALKIEKGRVTRFDASRGVKLKDGDDQACMIDLTSLQQEKSDAGILLKAQEDPDAGAQNPGKCGIRAIGDGKHLFVQMGDWTERDNDCRSTGDTMFCTPRAWWGDMVIDLTTGTCKSLE